MSQVFMISGHMDLSQEEFDSHYKQEIIKAVNIPNSLFITGAAPGTDYMAQMLLVELLGSDNLHRLTVYHKGNVPEKLASADIRTVSGFCSHDDRDIAMTNTSDIDIAYVRSHEESRKIYGDTFDPTRKSSTEKNIIRRMELNK